MVRAANSANIGLYSAADFPYIWPMRSKRLLALLVILFLSAGTARPAPAVKLVDLDASRLAPGKLVRWANPGSLGGEFRPAGPAPTVETVQGRPAVTFSGKGDYLVSTFRIPAALSGNHPFSAAAWVFDPGPGGKKTIAAWGEGAERSAEFGTGRGRNAAFFASDAAKLGYEGGVPPAGRWHHAAITFDGRMLRAYLDGRPSAERPMSPDVRPRPDILVGASWNPVRKSAAQPLVGSIASLSIYEGALSDHEIWNLAGHFEAFAPVPADGSAPAGPRIPLSWTVGSDLAARVRLYAATREADVEKADPSSPAFKGVFPASKTSFGPLEVAPGERWFWRADGLDESGQVRWPGQVWRFDVDAGAARSPLPADGIAAVRAALGELRWTPGPYASGQRVFFGTSSAALRGPKAVPLAVLGPAARSASLPGPLRPGRTYFWRIETANGSMPAQPGQVWSFRIDDPPDPGDITFFLVSDLHYGVSVTVAAANALTVEAMNRLAGQPYPKPVGGTVRSPRGVVVLGDLIDDGNAGDAAGPWGEFASDYDPAGRGRLLYPAYEGAGNHDGDPGRPVREGIRARNPKRPALRGLSADGQHYSWDWDRVHFVHLNLFPGSAGDDIINQWGTRFQGDWKLPGHSLEFLVDDLKKNVGASGRPVVIFQHYGWDAWSRGWYSARERRALGDALAGYNVPAVFWGHSHEVMRIDWRGIPTFCVGSGQKDPAPGEFLVVRITPTEMTVAERRTAGGWGMTDRISLR